MAAAGGAGASISDNLVPAPEASNKEIEVYTNLSHYASLFDYGKSTVSPYEWTVNTKTVPETGVTQTDYLYFRDAGKVMPLLESKRDFVVYFIVAHGSFNDKPFTLPAPVDGKGTPYCVIQTGAKHSMGCSFKNRGDNVIQTLFSKEILYSFQYLLGLIGDSIPGIFEDLHYSTNDYAVLSNGSNYIQEVPNKVLSFIDQAPTVDKSLVGKAFNKMGKWFGIPSELGVFMYDPNKFKMFAHTSLIDRLDTLSDKLITERKDITLEDLIPLIIESSPLKEPRPSIFVYYSCANVPFMLNMKFQKLYELLQQPSFYQYRPMISEWKYIPPIGSLPEYAISKTKVPKNFRRTKRNVYVTTAEETKNILTNALLDGEKLSEDEALKVAMRVKRVKNPFREPPSTKVNIHKRLRYPEEDTSAIRPGNISRLLEHGTSTTKLSGGTRKQRRRSHRLRKTARYHR